MKTYIQYENCYNDLQSKHFDCLIAPFENGNVQSVAHDIISRSVTTYAQRYCIPKIL